MSTPFDDPPFYDDPTIKLRETNIPRRPDHPRRPPITAKTMVLRAQGALRSPGARDPRLWLAVGLSAVLLIALSAFLAAPGAPERKIVTSAAFQGNLVQSLSTHGQLSSGIFNLAFLASGRVAAINVRVGQSVKAGTVLAKLDITQLQDSLNAAEAQLAVAQQNYNAALIGLQNAQDNQAVVDAAAQDAYNAVATPQAGKATPTPDQLQQAKDKLNETETQAQNAVNAAQAQADLAKTQVTSAQAAVDTAKHNVANSTLRAPVDGQVAQINGNVGQIVGINTSAAPSPLIVLVNLKTLQASGQVDETSIGQVQVGWPVAFTLRAYPQQTFYGSVAGISPIPDQQPGDVSYAVNVAIDANSVARARLLPAMTVTNLAIATNEAFGAILIPNAALTYAQTAVKQGKIPAVQAQTVLQQAQQKIVNSSDDALKEGQAAFVAEWQNGKLVAVPVVIGISDGTDTVVLAGLSVGNTVVVNG